MNYETKLLKEIGEIQSSKKPIILYGAGEICQICIKALDAMGKDQIVICDRDIELQNTKLLDRYEIISLEEVRKRYRQANYIICIYREKTTREIEEFLDKELDKETNCVYRKDALIYYHAIYVMKRKINSTRFAETIKRTADSSERSMVDSDIGVAISSFCDLRCKNCGYLLGHIKKRRNFDKELIVESVKNLANSVGAIERLSLVGGEPFLAKDLAWIAEKISQMDEVMVISLITNGRTFPSQDIIRGLKGKITCIMISDYGELSSCKEQVQKQFNEEGMVCFIGYKNTFNEWYPVNPPQKQYYSEDTLKERMKLCLSNKDQYFLKEGKLFICGYSAWAMTEGLMDLLTEDYVDLMDTKDLGDRLEQLRGKKILKCCEYCRVGIGEKVTAGEQMERL